jgi:DNA replication licensing factor MCM7
VIPSVPRELEEYIATAYSSIRQEEAKSNAPTSYTTIRTLLSILRISIVSKTWLWLFSLHNTIRKYLSLNNAAAARLSQALARLRFSETVAQSDVDEALRLMQMSKYSLYSDDRQRSGLDAISDIYSILRDEAARTSSMDVRYAHALNLISRKVQLLLLQTHTGTTMV